MKGSAIVIPVVAAILAGGVGFYAGMRHAYTNVAHAMSESLSIPAPPEPKVAPATWEISDYTDPMSDKRSFWLTTKNIGEPKATLQLSCNPAESISIYSDRFFTHSDDYYVTYRIDKRQAVSFDRWHSVSNFANPPDEDKFISELQGGHKLLVDIYSSGDTSYNLSFDISGYDKKLSEFRGRCNTLQSANPSRTHAS